jgi:hypothetical protein
VSLKKDLKLLNEELQKAKLVSTITTAASMFCMFKWMASSYGGQTVSKVPFEAIFPFKYVVRGGLDEDNKSPYVHPVFSTYTLLHESMYGCFAAIICS